MSDIRVWILIMIVVVGICIITKIILKKKLDSIDGFGGKTTKDMNEPSQNIIYFGEKYHK